MKKAPQIALVIVFLLILSAACTNSSKHPQALLKNRELTDEKSIREYTDSVNLLLPETQKNQSLIYTQEDREFSVTRYLLNGAPILYIVNENGGGNGKTEKRYYLQDDQLVLFTLHTRSLNNSTPFTQSKSYFRNNVLFYEEKKSAADSASLLKTSFAKAPLSKNNHQDEINTLEDALNERGRFNLVFEAITDYPNARYIILSKNEINAYRAVLKIEQDDEFIQELLQNQINYEGEKLKLQWLINENNEAVYQKGSFK